MRKENAPKIYSNRLFVWTLKEIWLYKHFLCTIENGLQYWTKIWPSPLDFSKMNHTSYCQQQPHRFSRIILRWNSKFWTTVHRGDFGNDPDYFLRNWTEYRNGFGRPDKELWMGLEYMFLLSNVEPVQVHNFILNSLI